MKNNEIISKTSNNELKILAGTNQNNSNYYLNLIKDYHILIIGSNNLGKSIFLTNIIDELIKNHSDNIEFCFIALKNNNLLQYNNLETNIGQIAKTKDLAKYMLNEISKILDARYKKYEDSGYNSFEQYGNNMDIIDRHLFFCIDSIDELIDSNDNIIKLQNILLLGKKCGIHLICTTQTQNESLPIAIKSNFALYICDNQNNTDNGDTFYIINNKNNNTIKFKNNSSESIKTIKEKINERKKITFEEIIPKLKAIGCILLGLIYVIIIIGEIAAIGFIFLVNIILGIILIFKKIKNR